MSVLRRALLPAALALATAPAPLLAEAAEDAARALEEAMDSMRVYLTCASLEPETFAFLRDYWSNMVEATVTHLHDRGIAPDNLAAFQASAGPEGLLPPPQTPFSELRAYCNSRSDWMARLTAFDLPQLPNALEAPPDAE